MDKRSNKHCDFLTIRLSSCRSQLKSVLLNTVSDPYLGLSSPLSSRNLPSPSLKLTRLTRPLAWPAARITPSPGHTSAHLQTLHCEKCIATRRTFISGAKMSSFVDILSLFVHVERGHVISKHVFHPFTLKQDS